MKTSHKIICAFMALGIIFVGTVNGSTGAHYSSSMKYGTGIAVAECIHNGETYAIRTANASCPGYQNHRCNRLGLCEPHADPNDHSCIETERYFGADPNL